METLEQIKTDALNILAQKGTMPALEYLLEELGKDAPGYNRALNLSGQWHVNKTEWERECLTKEEYKVGQNRIRFALVDFINALDQVPKEDDLTFLKLNEKQMLTAIWIFQILILIALMVLIFKQ